MFLKIWRIIKRELINLYRDVEYVDHKDPLDIEATF